MREQRSRQTETAPKYDLLLIIAVAALLIVGLMMVYSATAFWGVNYRPHNQQPTYFFFHQLLWMGLGLMAMIVAARIRYHTWRKLSIPIMVSALILLGAVLVTGDEQFGSRRWAFVGGSVQPSELVKLAVIIYIADWLSSKGERIHHVTYGLIPFSVLLGFVTGLILLQPDISTAVLIAVTALAMFFIAGGDLWQILVTGVLGSVPLALLISRSDYAMQRIVSFAYPLQDPYGESYQTIQSLIALASGGVTGMGLGASRQKFGYLPAAHTDHIFAVLGEELGLLGCLVVIALFAFLAYRGFRVAMNAPDLFGAVLAAGVTFNLIFQALINIAVVTATVPITGIPLPFISYGGSSIVVSLAGIGLLLSVSRGIPADEVADRQEEITNREAHDLGRGDRRSRVSRPGRRRLVDNRY